MTEAYIYDAIRTPIGRYGGALATLRADDLGAIPLRALMQRNPGVDWGRVDDVIYGCANQAGEDNRNVARMAALLAGLPYTVGGTTVNRLCGSGMDAVAMAARSIKAGEGALLLAGGVGDPGPELVLQVGVSVGEHPSLDLGFLGEALDGELAVGVQRRAGDEPVHGVADLLALATVGDAFSCLGHRLSVRCGSR